jgi:hypothetical protein
VGLADQPEGVDQQVPLATVDLLGAVVAVRPPFSVVLTLWLSRITALGVGLRPNCAAIGISRRTRRTAATSWVTVSWVATASSRVQEQAGRRLGKAKLAEGIGGIARLHELIAKHLDETPGGAGRGWD